MYPITREVTLLYTCTYNILLTTYYKPHNSCSVRFSYKFTKDVIALPASCPVFINSNETENGEFEGKYTMQTVSVLLAPNLQGIIVSSIFSVNIFTLYPSIIFI